MIASSAAQAWYTEDWHLPPEWAAEFARARSTDEPAGLGLGMAVDIDPASWLARSRSFPEVQTSSVAWEVAAVLCLCSVSDPAVGEFLTENSHLSVLVLEACHRLQAFFQSEVALRLQLTCDPEEGSDDLFLAVSGFGDVEAALDLLDRFDVEWLQFVPATLKEHFGITLGH